MKRSSFIKNDLGPGNKWCEVCKEVRLTEKNDFKGMCLKCAKELIDGKIAEASRDMMVNGEVWVAIDPAPVDVSGTIFMPSVSGVMYNNLNTKYITQSAIGPVDSNRPNPPRPTPPVVNSPPRRREDGISDMAYFPIIT